VKGRKRMTLVDTEGFIHGLCVQEASIPEPAGAKLVLLPLRGKIPRLLKIWVDQGFAGQLVDWVKYWLNVTLEVVKKPPKQQGFKVLPKRWIVERTFAWLLDDRRLVVDYEFCPKSSEAFIFLSALHRMLRRLAR
jgi:putative transposase